MDTTHLDGDGTLLDHLEDINSLLLVEAMELAQSHHCQGLVRHVCALSRYVMELGRRHARTVSNRNVAKMQLFEERISARLRGKSFSYISSTTAPRLIRS